ncbi:hypothetical protein C900_01542 [Fulvivirga imtechensis AK7]|uniref:Lipoprotein n=1 Tax=Fulvivirga imtechensis AK7 TaxID=1237149 RepID=L8JXU5_9BACT|nr:hypothetical protein [Fulvivirga imtechensis]ELR72459.1 hypothetical protein C900_01542 [Fulvivirga imtechensis AK7]
MKKLVLGFLVSLTFTACDIQIDSPFDLDGEKVYIIKEGAHESNRTPKPFDKKAMSFAAKFDKSAIYETQIEENQADINKLLGFSDCNNHHQDNSARFGWRWYNEQLEIHAYCYVNGNRTIKYITSVSLDQMNDYKIEIVDNKYVFTVNNTVRVEVNKNANCSGGINYMLFPYFGGDETAPHDISVTVHMD